MLVSSIDIEEFRGIVRCKTPLALSKFTVLVGRNNSGKSSVLEALSLLPMYSFRPPYIDDSRIDFVARLHAGKSSLVYGYSGGAMIKYKIQDKTWTIRIKDEGLDHQDIEGVEESNLLNNPALALAKIFDIDHRKDKLYDEVNNLVFFIPNDSYFMDRLHSKLRDEKYRNMVIKMGANTRVAELINKCVDDRYTEVLFTPEFSARKERGSGKSPLYIKVKDLGDGVQKAVLRALWLEAINPSLVLLDDFEGSAHPTLIKLLLEWLSKKSWQVIISTHSIDVLTSLLEVRPKDSKVIQLKKTNDDVLLHEDLTLEELENVIETSQDPRRLVDSLKL